MSETTDELERIARQMDGLKGHFVESSLSGLILPTEQSATFKRLLIEAKSLLDEALGHANDFSMSLMRGLNSCSVGFIDGPSYACVTECAENILGSLGAIRRREAKTPAVHFPGKSFVDPARIAAIKAISRAPWDYSRLIRLCEELNSAAHNSCHMSVAMLTRTIVDHVPPLFGHRTFAEVANNYNGSRSFKRSMQHLQGSMRNIADLHLHEPIRAQETLPNPTQVDFSADLDVLLGEVVRLAGKSSPTV